MGGLKTKQNNKILPTIAGLIQVSPFPSLPFLKKKFRTVYLLLSVGVELTARVPQVVTSLCMYWQHACTVTSTLVHHREVISYQRSG